MRTALKAVGSLKMWLSSIKRTEGCDRAITVVKMEVMIRSLKRSAVVDDNVNNESSERGKKRTQIICDVARCVEMTEKSGSSPATREIFIATTRASAHTGDENITQNSRKRPRTMHLRFKARN